MPVSTMSAPDSPTMSTTVESDFDHVSEVIAVMRKQESTTYLRSDYLMRQRQLENVLDSSWRQRIIEWMFGVVDHCSLRRDSVATAAFYLDICVERGLIKSREEFQLAAMTALQIAIKLCDSTVVKLQSMVALGRGLFTEQDVIKMEANMLATLQWHVHPPTPICFLRQFVRLLPEHVSPLTRYMIAEVTRFIAEISVCLYKFVKYPPSVIAYAGMLIAIERFDEATLPMQLRLEIQSAMAQFGGLESTSPLLLQAISELQLSLEKNMSLQELMATIDAQCHEGYNKMQSNDYTMMTNSGMMNSPRDVTGRAC